MAVMSSPTSASSYTTAASSLTSSSASSSYSQTTSATLSITHSDSLMDLMSSTDTDTDNADAYRARATRRRARRAGLGWAGGSHANTYRPGDAYSCPCSSRSNGSSRSVSRCGGCRNNSSSGSDDSYWCSSSDKSSLRDSESDSGHDQEDDEEDVQCSGTLKYMSPERLRGEAHGKPSDVWAVGVTLAEFALSVYPYDLTDLADDVFDRLARIEQPICFDAVNGKRLVPLGSAFQDFIRLATLPVASERPMAQELLEHPFFKQWDTPFNLRSYLAERIFVPPTKP